MRVARSRSLLVLTVPLGLLTPVPLLLVLPVMPSVMLASLIVLALVGTTGCNAAAAAAAVRFVGLVLASHQHPGLLQRGAMKLQQRHGVDCWIPSLYSSAQLGPG